MVFIVGEQNASADPLATAARAAGITERAALEGAARRAPKPTGANGQKEREMYRIYIYDNVLVPVWVDWHEIDYKPQNMLCDTWFKTEQEAQDVIDGIYSWISRLPAGQVARLSALAAAGSMGY